MTNFNEVTLHSNFEEESFFAASGELGVPACGQSTTDDSKHEGPRAKRWHI